MKFNIGDKVKFLNASGGGIITKIISPSLVNVMIDDGFEIPTMTSELIKIDPKGKVESMFDEEFPVPSSQSAVRSSASPSETGNWELGTGNGTPDRQSSLGNYSFRSKNTPGVYLAFVPHDQKWLVTGDMEIYLMNFTTFNVLYAFFLEGEMELKGKDYDVIFPGNKILIDTVDREALLKMTKGIVQLIFHHENPDKVVMPVSAEFDISPSRFNNENNYGFSQFIEEKLLIISLIQVAELIPVVKREESKMDEEALVKQKAIEMKPGSLIEKHQTGLHEAVVDLHIEELVEHPSILTPHDMLKVQMDYFVRCIESAAERNFRKVTFIHGVGNGVLKSAIIKKLQDYEHAPSHLASLAKFGVGAIDVVIKPMK